VFRLHSRSGNGGRRRLWLSVATTAALFAAAAPAQAAPFVYVTNFGSDSISQYEVGAGGLLAPLSPPTVAAADRPASVAVSPDARNVYVTNTFRDEVTQYDVSPGGTLSPKSPPSVAAGRFPTTVAVSPDGQSAYVSNAGDELDDIPASISQYDVGPGGALSPKNPATVASCGGLRLAVSPDGKSVYVTAGENQCISQYDVGRGGKLSPKTPGAVQDEFTPFGVAVSPDSQSVYVADFDGGVSQYSVRPNGTLSPKSPARVPAGLNSGVVAVSPDGGSVYVSNVSSNDVSQYDVATDGRLSPKSPPTVAVGHPGGVAVTPDARSAYVGHTEGNKVSQYDVRPGGALSPKSPPRVTAGDGPAGVAVSPLPTSKGQCKKGGWKQFGFKNQGQCTRFVRRQARQACAAERNRIGHQAFREKYGAGRHHRHAQCRCVKLAIGGR
jgi:DNA-binding beta-propeller fold protein YncE